ncbi:PD-(D/E)XK nuclease family protein [Xanthomarina sp. F2636L]|uniref:PD-(D/E)XK nuclease family protein n=1 Tax=Xanthomarina sp. F2636L TaxID=2996018 RepID=UPI00225DE29B|nr:PD-(D/E)XK nuclease family protein [Xanthomarina sp. F2636L]MCX7551213.1 PD-(D/E)XK nuclease family protein [Xanthomarina sp. F2636L]
MTTFIHEVLKTLKEKGESISNLTFILPSKRAGIFLKNDIAQVWEQTVFSPEILSIEEFTSNLSQLKPISNIELLFEFYTVYLKLTPQSEQDSFESFSKWAQLIIQDFNEIDRYLIPQKEILNYLSAIQDINHWSLQENKTEFVKKYLAFWNKLLDYYNEFTDNLIENNMGYQGLIYREAVNNIETYIQSNANKKLIFLGFNALNKAEETIIQELLQNDIAEIYWDIERTYLDNPLHDAGLFAKQYKDTWTYFKSNPFNWITNNYRQEKNISVFGVPKNIGQAKQIGSLLQTINNNQGDLSKTAIVLGDETLLLPVLNSLPDAVSALNITMGLPLNSVPIATLFEKLFYLHKDTSKSYYYKDVIGLLTHQNISPLFEISNRTKVTEIVDVIQQNNLVYLNLDQLKALSEPFEEIIDMLFASWENKVESALKQTQKLILTIKNYLDKEKAQNLLNLEYLYRFNELFNELTRLHSKYPYLKSINTLFEVYKNLLSTETLDFKGEPLQGLQVMGMLESRVLDFETVIISSVNEGILPSGKSNNSFIPFDVKLQYNLPTYKEKDAVYSYHFYRLIQRAKNIYILYNTEADVLNGGEKSRFITQLELEDIHNISHQVVLPNVRLPKTELNQIKKNTNVLERIKEIAEKGFSPSSLTNYIRNPIDFYNQKILKIGEYEEVEETVAANTLGNVIHNTLEDFYKPFEGEFITIEILSQMKTQVDKSVTYHFKDLYKEGDITKGKNLIIYEIAKRYLNNFLNLEIEDLKAGNQIKILAIESENKVLLKIDELDFPIFLTGKVDRVDQYNGTTRIIDYKTGKVAQNQVEVINWEELTTDYTKYSKSFQVLCYAYAMFNDAKVNLPLEAGVISFKNLNAGFLKFSKKESVYDRNKNTVISEDIIQSFETELKKLILEICNVEENFVEKEI